MFPEIARDEIFRIETRRLWLRWIAAHDVDEGWPQGSTTSTPLLRQVPDPTETSLVATWHRSMQAGGALHLSLELKGSGRPVVGFVHLTADGEAMVRLTYGLKAEWRGSGFATEAVQAVIDTTFMMTGTHGVCAASPVVESASRGVLERCGFTFVGTGMSRSAAAPGLSACDHFRLDRKTWRSLKGWNTPDFKDSVRLGTTAPLVCCVDGTSA